MRRSLLASFVLFVAFAFSGALHAETAAEALSKSASSKSANGDYTGALADLSKAIELDPGLAPAWRDRGVLRGALGDYQGSVADETVAIRLAPDSPLPYFARAIAKEGLGDREGAKTDMSKSAALGDPDARKWLTDHGY
jgi:tetratricopeptide (TPR) repeat protein